MLNQEQRDRYLRHILLREVGAQGQQRLLNSSVLIVGVGGLGSPVTQYLAAAGVGRLTLIDPDVIERSNLQRQTIYRTSDIGRLKVEAARDFALALNPGVEVFAIQGEINPHNAFDLISSCDVVVEGVDNFAARYVVNRAALAARRALVSMAVGRYDGQIATFSGHDGHSPCYRCLVPEAPRDAEASCETEGVVGPVTGVIGSLAALETIKLLLGLPDTLLGRMLIYRALPTDTRKVSVVRDPACIDCSVYLSP